MMMHVVVHLMIFIVVLVNTTAAQLMNEIIYLSLSRDLCTVITAHPLEDE